MFKYITLIIKYAPNIINAYRKIILYLTKSVPN